MRRLAALLAAIVALGLMCLSLPWDSLECQPPECSSQTGATDWGGFWFAAMAIGFYVLVPSVVLTAILVAVLRLRDAASPADAAVRFALGETRGAAVRKAAKRGTIDAALWVGGTYVLAGAAHLTMLASTGVYPWSRDGGLWLTRLAIAAVAAACLIAAHTLNALRSRPTPVEQLRPENSEPRMRRLTLRGRTLILGAATAVGAGVLMGANLAFQGGTRMAPPLAMVIANVAAWVVGVAVAAFAWGVLMPATRDAVPRIIGLAGTASTKLGLRGVGAVLQARASTRWLASSRVIIVLSGLAFIVGLASVAPTTLSSGDYTAIAAGVPAGSGDGISVCDADCDSVHQSLAAEDGVGAIVPAASAGINIREDSLGITLVDPADLDGIDDALAARLRSAPSVVHMAPTFERVTIDDFDWLGFQVTGIATLPNAFPRPIVNRAWAEQQAGPFDSTYFYTYPAAGWTPTQTYQSLIRTSSDDYLWAIERGGRSDWVDRDSAGSSSSGDYEQIGDGPPPEVDRTMQMQNLLLGGMLAALVLVPIAAVATAAVVRRRRDDATMAALGASVRTLRAAVVIEATVTAALALASGLLGGALTQAAVSTVQAALAGLYGVQLDMVIVTAVRAVDWLGLGALLGVTVAVFTVVSWLASRSLRSLSPVEALRPAKEGVLR